MHFDYAEALIDGIKQRFVFFFGSYQCLLDGVGDDRVDVTAGYFVWEKRGSVWKGLRVQLCGRVIGVQLFHRRAHILKTIFTKNTATPTFVWLCE